MSSNSYAKQYARSLRLQVITAYGAKCECCGESRFHFLTIDHKLNNGTQHRKSLRKDRKVWKGHNGIRTEGSLPFWNDLKRRGYPKDEYRCLCYNCNMGRHRNWEHPGICPHEIERGEIVSVALDEIKVSADNQSDWLSGKPVGAS